MRRFSVLGVFFVALSTFGLPALAQTPDEADEGVCDDLIGATLADPPMPCRNVVQDECRCWTELELDGVALEGGVQECTDGGIPDGLALSNGIEIAFAIGPSHREPACNYRTTDPYIYRAIILEQEGFSTCYQSLQAECDARGLPYP